MTPPTLNMWVNWYSNQWNQYIQYSSYALNHPLVQSLEDPIVVFRQPTDKSYARYRELIQLIDVAVLDASTLQYHPRAIVASALYVLLAFHFGQATKEEIATLFCKGSQFLNALHPFNDLFGYFLETDFGLSLQELLPTIQYISTFMSLPFNFQVPGNEMGAEYHFEDFVSLQTYHPLQMEYIKARME